MPIVSTMSSDRRPYILLAAVALLLTIYLLPSPPPLARAEGAIPLTPQGQACLAILAFAVTLWVTETLPFAVTSLLVVVLIPVFGLADYRTVVRAGFGDPIITFFLGVLMLSSAFPRSGLGPRHAAPMTILGDMERSACRRRHSNAAIAREKSLRSPRSVSIASNTRP